MTSDNRLTPDDSRLGDSGLTTDRDRLNRDRFERPVARFARRRLGDFLHDLHAFDHFAEDTSLVVEPWRRRKRDEELAAVGVRPGVGHRQDAGLVVPQLWAELVSELVAGAAGPRAE